MSMIFSDQIKSWQLCCRCTWVKTQSMLVQVYWSFSDIPTAPQPGKHNQNSKNTTVKTAMHSKCNMFLLSSKIPLKRRLNFKHIHLFKSDEKVSFSAFTCRFAFTIMCINHKEAIFHLGPVSAGCKRKGAINQWSQMIPKITTQSYTAKTGPLETCKISANGVRKVVSSRFLILGKKSDH